jgi:hypothetical protein
MKNTVSQNSHKKYTVRARCGDTCFVILAISEVEVGASSAWERLVRHHLKHKIETRGLVA